MPTIKFGRHAAALGLLFAGSIALFGTELILSNVADSTSGLGILLWLISTALSTWAFVELGCLRGTIGPNRFVPDPLQAASVTAAAAA